MLLLLRFSSSFNNPICFIFQLRMAFWRRSTPTWTIASWVFLYSFHPSRLIWMLSQIGVFFTVLNFTCNGFVIFFFELVMDLCFVAWKNISYMICREWFVHMIWDFIFRLGLIFHKLGLICLLFVTYRMWLFMHWGFVER